MFSFLSLAEVTRFSLFSTSESWGGGSSGWFKYHLEKCDWLSTKPNKWGSDNYSFASHQSSKDSTVCASRCRIRGGFSFTCLVTEIKHYITNENV